MKLIFIIQGMQSGGAERVMSILCNTYVRQGHSIILGLTENAQKSVYELDSRIKLVDLTDSTCNKRVSSKRFRSILQMKKLFQTEKPDVVISFITRTNICAVIAGRLSGIPVIISERNDPAVDPKSKTTRTLRDIIYPFANGCVFQTEYALNYFKKSVKNRGKVIFNPVSTDMYSVDNKKKRNKRIVALCRLNSQKNLPMLINAFKKADEMFPGYCLEIYGEGEEQESLKSIINKLKLQNKIILKGHTSQPLQILAESEIFALSSNYEGMPNSLIEAMCMGCACVATDSPAYGARELIKDGKNGLLVKVGDESAFAEALYLLMKDDNKRKELSRCALLVEKRVNADNITSQWMDFIIEKAERNHRLCEKKR